MRVPHIGVAQVLPYGMRLLLQELRHLELVVEVGLLVAVDILADIMEEELAVLLVIVGMKRLEIIRLIALQQVAILGQLEGSPLGEVTLEHFHGEVQEQDQAAILVLAVILAPRLREEIAIVALVVVIVVP